MQSKFQLCEVWTIGWLRELFREMLTGHFLLSKTRTDFILSTGTQTLADKIYKTAQFGATVNFNRNVEGAVKYGLLFKQNT